MLAPTASYPCLLGSVGVKGALLPRGPLSLPPCLPAGWALPASLRVGARVGAAAATPRSAASWGLLGTGLGGSAQRWTHGGDTRPCPARNPRPRGSGRFSCTLLGRFLRRHKPGSLQIPLRWGRRCTGVPSDPNHSPPAPGVPVSLGVTPLLQSSQGQPAAKGSTTPHQQHPPAAAACPSVPTNMWGAD